MYAGSIENRSVICQLPDKTLHLTVKQPELVYPGQKVKVEVNAYCGDKPAKDVDITAYAVTSKFGNEYYTNFPNARAKRKAVRNYLHGVLDKKAFTDKLDLDTLTKKMFTGLDTIDYYKFLFPKDTVYKYNYHTKDNTIQFSPFVVANGKIVPVHVVYIDSQPVYISFVNNDYPYSFYIKWRGEHDVKIRTADRLINLGNINFNDGERLIMSIDQNKYPNFQKMEARLSDTERNILTSYLMVLSENDNGQYAYLNQGGNIFRLKKNNNIRHRDELIVGPVTENSLGYYDYDVDKLYKSFRYESGYSYDLNGDNVIKMRSYDFSKQDWCKEFKTTPKQDFRETALTVDSIRKEKELRELADFYLKRERLTPVFNNLHTDFLNSSRVYMSLRFNKGDKFMFPLTYLLLNEQDHAVLQVCPADNSIFGVLKGHYKLYAIFRDNEYALVDSIYIDKPGNYYLKDQSIHVQNADGKSIGVNRVLNEFVSVAQKKWNDYIQFKGENKNCQELVDVLYRLDSVLYTGKDIRKNKVSNKYLFDRFIGGTSGRVTNEQGMSLGGALVRFKGTQIGTFTNRDGHFTIDNIPMDNSTLEISYPGMETKIVQRSDTWVTLKPGKSKQDSVYYVDELYNEDVFDENGDFFVHRDVVTSVSSIGAEQLKDISVSSTSESLQGRLSGVSITEGSPDADMRVRVRGGGSMNQSSDALYIVDGFPVSDINDISPSDIQSMDVLKGEQAIAVYGAKGANGVIVVTTKSGKYKGKLLTGVSEDSKLNDKGASMDDNFMQQAMSASTMRSNFSDYAFWQPRLKTDKNGKATFEITYPDDITRWKTTFFGIRKKDSYARFEKEVKSYKPLSGQLYLPRFLVQGDSSYVLGKALNYGSDTVKAKTSFVLDGIETQPKSVSVISGVVDSFRIQAASTDSMKVGYKVQTANGYFDGESRTIPVYPAGIMETKGVFCVMDRDTSFTVNLPKGQTNVYMENNELSVMLEEMEHLFSYEHLCNEQMSSKLIAYLYYEKVCKLQSKKFKYKRDVETLIRKLEANQNDHKMWGWWNKSQQDVAWLSMHVYRALWLAQEMGYKVKIDFNSDYLIHKLTTEMDSTIMKRNNIEELQFLKSIHAPISYKKYIDEIDKSDEVLSTEEYFSLIRLKQLCGLPYSVSYINNHLKQTMFGNIYYSNGDMYDDSFYYHYLWGEDEELTLLAYSILKADTANPVKLRKMRNWFYEKRGVNGWRNTYVSAQIMDVLLPDILEGEKSMKPAEVTITTGNTKQVFKDFPASFKNEGESFTVSKTGTSPVFFTAFQKTWNQLPKEKKSDFEIETRFERTNNLLKAGKPVKLMVHLEVKKSAEYTMIQIPIPAGCSYESKSTTYFGFQDYSEFFKNKLVIYCSTLPAGRYDFEINLMPRYTGSYVLNPAQVELMYFPVFNANNAMKRVEIR
jgi:TonB-dependent SusC/RagA subfamily outer membrane receptor